MFTPQQIEQISFGKATFGGYNMDDVDEFLEPLCEDYVTLYKENALLKSKMRVLVGKLEEYRKNEAAMKEAVAEAKKTCDKMVHEAEVKCQQMMQSAPAATGSEKQGNKWNKNYTRIKYADLCFSFCATRLLPKGRAEMPTAHLL